MTAPDPISLIRLAYRDAKWFESVRIKIDRSLEARVVSLMGDEPADRKKRFLLAAKIIKAARSSKDIPDDGTAEYGLYMDAAAVTLSLDATRDWLIAQCKKRQNEARKIVRTLPAWARIGEVMGFGEWGLAALIGEAGDIGQYSGCRKLFKRLGLAPDECYQRGEKSTGRMIPRKARGRVMGIVADALLRAQWRGAKDEAAAHPIGPYGKVYGDAKVRQLAAGRTKMHADRLARRAMVKALIHDVHNAWHGKPLDYVGRP